MKYLVNRETKEHRIYDEEKARGDQNLVSGYWKIVQADSEGWIPWSGGECPLADDFSYEVKIASGKIIEGLDRPQTNQWRSVSGSSNIIAYRPILTEQSEPAPVVADVFHRLRTATEHAASIPSIIAEIDELLGAEWTVVRVWKVEATEPQERSNVQWSKAWARKVRNWIAITEQVTTSCQSKHHRDELRKLREQISDYLAHGISKTDEILTETAPQEDMSDWRKGDKIEILIDEGGHEFDIGEVVTITGSVEAERGLFLCLGSDHSGYVNRSEAKFHSRPTGATK